MSANIYIAPIGLGWVFLAEQSVPGETARVDYRLGLRLVNGEFELGDPAPSFAGALTQFASRPLTNPEITWRIPRDLEKWLGPYRHDLDEFLATNWWEI